jgi:D-alanine-D-alanine ligase
MRIGLTFDLRSDYLETGYTEEETAEFDSEATIDAIAASLGRLGFHVDRIGHVRRLTEKLVAGDRWDLVFNIAEGIRGRSREAQVPAILEAYDIPYVFSDPLTSAVTLDKAAAKRLVRDAGMPTADFAILGANRDADTADVTFPAFVKPVAEGTGKGCGEASRVETRPHLKAISRTLRARFRQPVLVETYLPGREFTVGILGNGADARVLGVMEISFLRHDQDAIYSLEAKEHWQSSVRYALADDEEALQAGELALRAYHALECRDAARLDLRSDAYGVPHFLEANILPGLRPNYSDLTILADLVGLSYDQFIAEILQAAITRLGLHTQLRRAAPGL